MFDKLSNYELFRYAGFDERPRYDFSEEPAVYEKPPRAVVEGT